MKKCFLICLFLGAVFVQGGQLLAQENSVVIIPISKGYAFYYDGGYHDYCGRTKYLKPDLDTLNQIVLTPASVISDTVVISNDHYGQECFIYDACIVGKRFYVNVYIPKWKTGSYVIDLTPLECQLLEFAVAQVGNYDKTVFLPEYHGLRSSNSFSCHDCDAMSYIRMKRDSVYTEYLIHALADSIPDALIFLRDVVGALIENNCRNEQRISTSVENNSTRNRFCDMARQKNCPLGLVGDILTTQKGNRNNR